MRGLLRRKIHLWRDSRGLSAVEFAVVTPILLMLLGGIIDLGNFYYISSTVTQAAETGARLAAVGKSAQVVSTIQSTYPGYQVAMTPTTPTPKNPVTVRVTAPVTFNFPMVSVFFPDNPTVTGQCVMYVE